MTQLDRMATVPDTTRDLSSAGAGLADWLWRSPGRFLCLLVAFLFAAFPTVLLGWDTFFYRDYGVLAYPFVYHQRECFWRGELPLWNPLSNCGAPFLAQWGTMTLYPMSLVYLILPLPWSLGLFCVGHMALGGVGMYSLACRWAGVRYAAAVAGLVYVFNGVAFSCLLWPNYTVALGWLPWVIALAQRGWREGGRWVGAGALVSALQLLSGAPEIVLFTWLVGGSFWVRDLVGAGHGRWGVAVRAMVVVLLAGGLAAAQLLPFLDLLAHSQRDAGFATSKWAMPGWGWANLLVPMFHCFQTPQGTFFQSGQAFLSSYYLGGLTLILAGWAAWKIRTGQVWILGGWVVFSLMLALGDHTPVYPWLRGMLPFLGIGRYPVKFMILTAFAIPMMAAFALARLERPGRAPNATVHRKETQTRSLLGLGVAATVGMIAILWVAKLHPLPHDQWDMTLANSAWRFGFLGAGLALLILARRNVSSRVGLLLRVGVLALLAADIVTHSPNQVPTLPSAIMEPGLWKQHAETVPPTAGRSRAWITPEAERHLLHSTVEDPMNDFVGKRLGLWSNLNLLEGIPKVNGSSTLQLREQKEVQDLVYPETNGVPTGLLDFLAVSIQSVAGSPLEWTNRPSGLPWIRGGQRPLFADDTEVVRRLVQSEFDPRAVVYLPPEAQTEVGRFERISCRVQLEEFSDHQIVFRVEAGGPSLVVLAQSFYHPWKAFVDGNPRTLWRANHAFQAVAVPEGKHQVRLRYEDRSFQWGGVMSLASLVVCAWIVFRRKRPSVPGSPQSVRLTTSAP